mmetsp:Transcript_27401/g.45675  ORF Transcript_27401/g.45675 Transcript_27401/m.45675 type:complete len:229 (-) Transcript_27401:122-808(-)
MGGVLQKCLCSARHVVTRSTWLHRALTKRTGTYMLQKSHAATSSGPREYVNKPANNAEKNFGPASSRDEILYSCERPDKPHGITANGDGLPGSIPVSAITEWAEFMRARQVKRVLILLDENEVAMYAPPGLLVTYRTLGFIATHVPMGDPDAVSRVMAAISDAEAAGERIVAHCTHGMGRSGRVVAAWLVKRYGLTVEEATEEVMQSAKQENVTRLGSADKLAGWLSH